MKTIDCHAHLQDSKIFDKLEEIIAEAKEKMEFILCAGAHADWDQTAIDIAEKYPNFVYPYLGLHPNEVTKMSDKDIEAEMQFIRDNKDKIVAIGEVGLDHHWEKDSKKQAIQEKWFRKYIELALELDLPLVTHTWDAEERALEILKEMGAKNVMMHCLTNKNVVEKCIQLGYYVSISTLVCMSKDVKKIARDTPLEKMLIETDAPWLSPVHGKPNMPWNTKIAAEKIAKIKECSVEEVLENVKKNARELFGI